MAAFNYEDVFQVSIPVLEGLFTREDDDFDAEIQDLLFVFLNWHALVKLRLHTDSTIQFLSEALRALGAHL